MGARNSRGSPELFKKSGAKICTKHAIQVSTFSLRELNLYNNDGIGLYLPPLLG